MQKIKSRKWFINFVVTFFLCSLACVSLTYAGPWRDQFDQRLLESSFLCGKQMPDGTICVEVAGPGHHHSVYLYEDASGYLNMRSASGGGDQKYLTPAAIKFTLTDNITWGVAAGGSQVWTWDTGNATDPAVTFADGVVNVSAGALQQGGTAVSLTGHVHAGSDITTGDLDPDLLAGDTVDDGFIDAAIGGLGDISTVEGFPYLDGAGGLSWVMPSFSPGAGLDLHDLISGTPNTNDVPKWNGTAWVPATPSSGAAYDDISAPDANSTIGFTGYTNTHTSTLDGGNVYTLSNTTADLTSPTVLWTLKFADDGDADGWFFKFFDNAGNDLKASLDMDGNFYVASSITVGASASALVNEYQEVDKTIWQPDLINTTVPILHVDADKYPYGIKLVNVQITLPADAAYSMVFEEWTGDPPAAVNDIETVTTTASDAYMEVRTTDIDDSDIAADNYIFLHIPATDVPWVQVKVVFYAKSS